jgi:recombinational DNA repair protein RecR
VKRWLTQLACRLGFHVWRKELSTDYTTLLEELITSTRTRKCQVCGHVTRKKLLF